PPDRARRLLPGPRRAGRSGLRDTRRGTADAPRRRAREPASGAALPDRPRRWGTGGPPGGGAHVLLEDPGRRRRSPGLDGRGPRAPRRVRSLAAARQAPV